MNEKKEVEYRLTWSGRKEHPALRGAVEHLKTFPLFKDSKAELIDHTRYMELVEAKEIAEPVSYWQIQEGEIGLISLDYYKTYSKTWESISMAKGDFIDGWLAHEKYVG